MVASHFTAGNKLRVFSYNFIPSLTLRSSCTYSCSWCSFKSFSVHLRRLLSPNNNISFSRTNSQILYENPFTAQMERRNANMPSSSAGFLADQLRFIHNTCNSACIHYLDIFTEDCKRWPPPEDRRRIMEMYETVGASDSLLENARIVDEIQKLTGTARALDTREFYPDLLGFPLPVDLIVTASIIREAYENPDSQHDVLYGLYRAGSILLGVLLGLPKKAKELLQAAEHAYAIDVNLLRATIDKMVGRGQINTVVEQGQIIPVVKQDEWGSSARRFPN